VAWPSDSRSHTRTVPSQLPDSSNSGLRRDVAAHRTGGHRLPDLRRPASVVNDVWTSFVQYWGGPGVVGMETDQFLDAGDHVVVTGRYTGKDSAGHALDAPCAHVWRMEGGFAVRFQNYTDWTV